MNFFLNKIDSEALSRPVVALPSAFEDIESIEKKITECYKNPYIYTKLPLEDINSIALLTSYGYKVVEVQIKTRVNFRANYDTSTQPYEYKLVQDSIELDQVLEIGGNSIEHDRFTVDCRIGKIKSGSRYQQYLLKSYNSPDEQIWCLKSKENGEVLAFRSHKCLPGNTAVLLLGAVRSDLKNYGLGVVSSQYFFNQMKADGIKSAETYISAINYPIINLEIGAFGFKAVGSYVALRKIID